MKRKGQALNLGGLSGVIVLLVLTALVGTFLGQVLGNVTEDYKDESNAACNVNGTGCGTAVNISLNGQNGVTAIYDQFGNVGTVVGAGLIIGILVAAFVVGSGRVQFR